MQSIITSLHIYEIIYIIALCLPSHGNDPDCKVGPLLFLGPSVNCFSKEKSNKLKMRGNLYPF